MPLAKAFNSIYTVNLPNTLSGCLKRLDLMSFNPEVYDVTIVANQVASSSRIEDYILSLLSSGPRRY